MKITTNIYLSLIVATALIIAPEISGKRYQYITDQLGITSIPVANIITPNSIEELQTAVRISTLPISIAGACYSQGGQTGYPNGLVIDMNKLNKIVSLNKK